MSLKGSTIFLLIEYEGRTGGYIPEVLGIRNEHSKVLFFFFFIEINFQFQYIYTQQHYTIPIKRQRCNYSQLSIHFTFICNIC